MSVLLQTKTVYHCSLCGTAGHTARNCPSRIPKDPQQWRQEQQEKIENRFPGVLALLGVESDTEIARKNNVTREYIRQLRLRLQIPRSPAISTLPLSEKGIEKG